MTLVRVLSWVAVIGFGGVIVLANIAEHARAGEVLKPRDPFTQLLDADEREELAGQVERNARRRDELPGRDPAPADEGREADSPARAGSTAASGSGAGSGVVVGLLAAGYGAAAAALLAGCAAVVAVAALLRTRR